MPAQCQRTCWAGTFAPRKKGAGPQGREQKAQDWRSPEDTMAGLGRERWVEACSSGQHPLKPVQGAGAGQQVERAEVWDVSPHFRVTNNSTQREQRAQLLPNRHRPQGKRKDAAGH